jgi:AcrR family transcriptional regulator
MASRQRSKTRTRRDKRVDPRVERSRIVILEAAVDERADKGYGGVTIEAIADRAGAQAVS